MNCRLDSGFSCLAAALVCAALPFGAQAAEQQPQDALVHSLGDDASLKMSIEAGAHFLIENNSFWSLADIYAPDAKYEEDVVWGEAYLKPGLKLDARLGDNLQLRAGASAIAAATLGTDVFAIRDEARLVLEDAYAAIRAGDAATGWQLDISAGSQPYSIGSGMLIADGGVDGFERGALIFGPRKAWGMAATAKVSRKALSLEAFHLNPRELKSGNSRTVINGARLEMVLGQDRYAGLVYGHVPRSEAPYAKAAAGGVGAPEILLNGRDGLRFVHGYAKVSPLPARMPGLVISADYVRQWNDKIRLRASGGRIEVSNTFVTTKWMPTISYAYQSLSGDDPATPRLERFDPLFYDGSPSGWATGSNGSFAFINSNVAAHRFKLGLMPSQRDIVTLRYAHVMANHLRSPIQFGQATRPDFTPGAPGLVAGVTGKHLADDVLLEYTRVITPNVYLTAILAHSWAGKGLDRLAFGQSRDWTGGGVNIVVMY